MNKDLKLNIIGTFLIIIIIGFGVYWFNRDTATNRMIITRDFKNEYPKSIIIQIQPNIIATHYDIIAFNDMIGGTSKYTGRYKLKDEKIVYRKLKYTFLPNPEPTSINLYDSYFGV